MSSSDTADPSSRGNGTSAPPSNAMPSHPPVDASSTAYVNAELAGDLLPTSQQPPPRPAPTESPDRPDMKAEGSEYAGAYRPSGNADEPPPTSASAHYGSDAPQVDNSAPNPDYPPPAYSEIPGQITDDGNTELGTNAVVAEDGRVNIRINQKSRTLSQIFGPQLQQQLTQVQHEQPPPPPYVPEFLGGAPGQQPPPPLNVVIMVVGSRGDVQPFVALGKVLQETYGHRVRLATHPTFSKFVTENGLEFFSIGGDPAELMAFMVKNPGLMPGFDTLKSGDVGKRRRGIAEILSGTWRACIETGDGLGVDPLRQSVEEWMNIEADMPEQLKKPFVADAIIANPPSFGHIHCAEKLGIPLHMMFTMPWSSTQQFPHPLANIQSSNADPNITNYMSYTLVDMLTWQGLGDVINRFRKDSLGLDPIGILRAPGMLDKLKIPYTYCWSPALIPKPPDWGHHISIAGFYFLSLAQDYTPEPALAEFLAAGEPPVYIGFGSIVVDDPNAMTKLIFEAVKLTGRRALVSKGWGGLGADDLGMPEGVFMLGNCPHDWLFQHVSAVVHHGGAGTTAAGIAAGRPTVVVPFFGDQPFWGAMTARAGAGPMPIAYKELTADKLAGAIDEALKPESLERAQELSRKISQETGSQSGAQAFHQMLKYDELRCGVSPSRPAVWRLKRTKVRLSAMAATILAQEGELNFSELKLYRPREYETDAGPLDPITGATSALLGTASSIMLGVADMPIETLKLLSIHPDCRKGKERAKTSDTGSDADRTGRPEDPKTITTTQVSAASSQSTLTLVQTPSIEHLPQSPDGSTIASPEAGPGTPTHRSTFMAQAMAASTQYSRSPSRDRQRSVGGSRHSRARSISTAELRSDSGSSNFGDRLQGMNAEAAVHTTKGLGRIMGAISRSPMDFSLGVARGLHNTPKLFGGEVRQVDKVTDLQSGVKTAVKELGYGFYDGITGLVTDPYKGAKKEGGIGFVKGLGRGIFGVPFKVMSGVFALPGYAMKGLYQEALKGKGAGIQNYIIAARISQGYEEAGSVSPTQREDIISRWRCIRTNVKKKKYAGETQLEALETLMNDRKKKRTERRATTNRPSLSDSRQSSIYSDLPEAVDTGDVQSPGARRPTPRTHANTFSYNSNSQSRSQSSSQTSLLQRAQTQQSVAQESAQEETERRELEAAIAASVAEGSNGNPEDDEILARAIRASVIELQRPTAEDDEDTEMALKRAVTASLEDAEKHGASREDQEILKETLERSLLDTQKRRASDSDWDDSDTEDDEEFKRIVAESKELAHLQQAYAGSAQESGVLGALAPKNADDEEALRKVLEESEKAEQDRKAQMEKQGGALASNNEDEEEALRKVLEESEKAEQDRKAQMEEQGGALASNNEDDEEALRKVLAESETAERERKAHADKQMSEEEIVLEYVKKQSLAEEEHRRRLAEGRDTAGGSAGAGGSSR